MACIVLLPICFVVARYVPPLFHHTILCEGESTHNRVQSSEPYDSETYPETEKIVDNLLERLLGIDIIQSAKVETSEEVVVESAAVIGDGSDALHPILIPDKSLGTFSARIEIWKVYIDRLNFMGHEKEQPNVWLTEHFCIIHAHNVFLEFSYRFGIITGVCFFLAYFVCAMYQLVWAYKTKDGIQFTILIMLIIMAIFGMAEMCWFTGQAPIVIFYFMICNIIWSRKSVEERF